MGSRVGADIHLAPGTGTRRLTCLAISATVDDDALSRFVHALEFECRRCP
jgi:hypothetical protein